MPTRSVQASPALFTGNGIDRQIARVHPDHFGSQVTRFSLPIRIN